MPKRKDISTILVIGSGPIVIGQACEFDYSGTQACQALRREGYRIVLVNSNPATIMTDPGTADRVYIEPIATEALEKVIAAERPDALLPTLGGQTALNAAIQLFEQGILERYGVELIGAQIDAIRKAEDRQLFRDAMEKIGLDMPRSEIVSSVEGAERLADLYGYPLILRPSFTLGGTGGSIVETAAELTQKVSAAIQASPVGEVLVDESILGWKEYELEVMRDRADNAVIICSIENLDPMGVHTGDSITVAPALTLTDREYQALRDAALACIREIGVDTGGSNVQFGVCPKTGRIVIIEMNPRVSRSSALASKATGYPIAKIAALLAVGYTLDEITNDITQTTPASFEPTIDYIVTKIPRFTFEKFGDTEPVLGTQMKSVGEVMALGRTFAESFQKAVRGLETGMCGLEPVFAGNVDNLLGLLRTPNPDRCWQIADAFRHGVSLEEIQRITGIDPWFLAEFERLVKTEGEISASSLDILNEDEWRYIKQLGFSDRRIGQLLDMPEEMVRSRRHQLGIRPVFKRVDTCAAEFSAHTPYLYSTYEDECESAPTDRKKVMILGGGPNRIGQGIEFDYCCVHAVLGLQKDGFETIMVNCNPETVSTDYDTADRLYFEPLTLEDVLEIVEVEKPQGLIVQFGGQTPLSLARELQANGVPILGTTPDAIDRAEDRERFKELVESLHLKQPQNGIARSSEEALTVAETIGFPVVVRPSYVLGGRAMEIVGTVDALTRYTRQAVQASPEHPVLIDQFLQGAIELDVDCVSDGVNVVIGGIMEHVEEAGIHSGDSACSLPPYTIPEFVLDRVREQTRRLAIELGVVGLMNIQFALQPTQSREYEIFLLEVNPRASRTVPFVAKATGVPLAQLAARVMAGASLESLEFLREVRPTHYSVKEAVFPFLKFTGVDTLLGPEMKSTGEVMGIGDDFATAFLKSQQGAGNALPRSGAVLVAVDDDDKPGFLPLIERLSYQGFQIFATAGTASVVEGIGIPVSVVAKQHESGRTTVDLINDGDVSLVFCTTKGPERIERSRGLRQAALSRGVPYFTTLVGSRAAVEAIDKASTNTLGVQAIQDYHRSLREG